LRIESLNRFNADTPIPKTKAAMCVVALNLGMNTNATVTTRNVITEGCLHHGEFNDGVLAPRVAYRTFENPITGRKLSG